MSLFNSKSGLTVIDRLVMEKKIEENLEKKIEEKLSIKKKVVKETTTKQQLLILYYLGILDFVKLEDRTKSAKLFSTLLSKSHKNVYDGLSQINVKAERSEIKTAMNLKVILPLFEEIGLTEALKKIKADMAELKID